MIQEIDALIRSRVRDTKQTEVVIVSEVSGTKARIQRQGQSAETRFLAVASGIIVEEGDRAQLVRINGNLNTAYIAAKVG